MRTLLRWTIFPVLMAICLAGAWLALGHHVPVPLLFPAGGLAFAVAVSALERWLPYRRAWQRSHGDLVTDIWHLAISGFVVASAPQIGLSRLLGAGLWPTAWPIAAQVAFALVVAELTSYWIHRLHHRWLWRVHAIHHSAPRLYWINSWRTHPIEALICSFGTLLPLFVLGAPEAVVVLYAAFGGVFRMLQHSNVDVRLGPLNWIFSMAEVHRWHHSRRLEEADANYGNILLVWDLVFGTRHFPADCLPPDDIGLVAPAAFPTGYVAQLAAPLSRALWR